MVWITRSEESILDFDLETGVGVWIAPGGGGGVGACSCGSVHAPPVHNTPHAPEEAQLDPSALASQYMSNISSFAAGAMGGLASGELAVAATADFSHGTGTAVYAVFECCT